jgi:hypothetical protein
LPIEKEFRDFNENILSPQHVASWFPMFKQLVMDSDVVLEAKEFHGEVRLLDETYEVHGIPDTKVFISVPSKFTGYYFRVPSSPHCTISLVSALNLIAEIKSVLDYDREWILQTWNGYGFVVLAIDIDLLNHLRSKFSSALKAGLEDVMSKNPLYA